MIMSYNVAISVAPPDFDPIYGEVSAKPGLSGKLFKGFNEINYLILYRVCFCFHWMMT